MVRPRRPPLPVGILGPVGIRVVSLLARLGLAAVWLASGSVKASDPARTLFAVRAHRLLPESAISTPSRRPIARAEGLTR